MTSNFSLRAGVRRVTEARSGSSFALRQMAILIAFVGLISLLAAAHLAAVARPLFVVGALAIAYRSMRKSPWCYLTMSLWFWTISPFVRRVVDYYGGFQAQSIILITPNLVALLMLKPILTSTHLLRRREAIPGLLLLGPVLCGLAVSFFKGDILPGAIASIDWLVPLFYYFYVIDLIPRIREGDAHFRAFVPLNLGVVAFYGIYQCFSIPPWDMAWVMNVKMFTMAGAGDFTVKPFSMLNSPGPGAAWVAAFILLSLYFRNRLSIVVLPAAVFYLALTQVRADLGAVVFGLAVALFSGHRQIVKSLLLFVALAAVVVGTMVAFDPHLAQTLGGRFGTVGDLGADQSAQARTELYRSLPDLLDKYPLGMGIGAIGRGAAASNGDLVSVDGGPIAIYLALGWLPGTVYFAGMIVMVAQALLAARRSNSPMALALAIAALGGTATVLFTNLVGLQGLVIWLPAAYAIALGARQPAVGLSQMTAAPDFPQVFAGSLFGVRGS
jgi:hypothetical protein